MKQNKVGNVILDYQFYDESHHYSDGDIEDTLLDAAKNNRLEELLYSSNQWAVLYHCSKIRENLLEWYPFEKEASLLEVGSGCGALTGLFSRKVKSVTCIELSERRSLINAYRNQECDNVKIILGNFKDIEITEKFDYITLIGVWEYAALYLDGENPYLQMLTVLRQYLKKDGKLFIAIENKMGLKYWNGAPEDHTGKIYGGLNDYIDSNRNVRTFSRPEIEALLKTAGWDAFEFYYPMPDYKLPETIYSDNRLPNPGEIRTYKKDYNATRIYNFYDATISDQISTDNMIPYFANSFLVECGNNLQNNIVYAKYSRMRHEQYRISTVIRRNGKRKIVEKRALTDKAKKHVRYMSENALKILPRLIPVNGWMEEDVFVVDYIEGMSMDVILYQYRNDVKIFINKVKGIIEKFLTPDSSEMIEFEMTENYKTIFGTKYIEKAKCLKTSNVDLTFSNLCLTQKGEVYCIDNEWIYNFPIPYEYIIWRAVSEIYSKYMIYLRNKISRHNFFIETGLNAEHLKICKEMDINFVNYIVGKDYRDNYKKSSVLYDFRFV